MSQTQPQLEPAADALDVAAPPRSPTSGAAIGAAVGTATVAGPGDGDSRVRPSRAEHLVAVGRLHVRSERRGADHVVALSGELDLATAQRVEEALKAAEAGDADRVILDLSGLDFIDSTGIRLVILADTRSKTNGCRLSLRRGPRHVQRVFELTGVAKTLPFAD